MEIATIDETASIRPKIGWDVFIIITTFSSGLVIPARLIFNGTRFDLYFWALVGVFIADIMIVYRRGLMAQFDQFNVRGFQHIEYLSTWFLLDLVAALPLAPIASWIIGENGIESSLVITLGFLPLLKIIKLNKMFNDLQEKIVVNPSIFRLIIFVFWITLSAHLISLTWIVIGAVDLSLPPLERYTSALYWAVTTLSSVGYGDVVPDKSSLPQVIFSMMVMLLGVGMYGYIIGNLATLIANIDIAKTKYLEKMEEINAYIKAKDIPPALQNRVRNYYKYMWETHKSTTTRSVLDELPHTLSQEIALVLNKNIIEKVPFFHDADEIFLREIIQEMELRVFLPGDFIIRQGEYGESMYFLSSGEVEVLVGDQVVANLGTGSFFGEGALVKGERRNASVRTTTYCDVNRLSKKSFDKLRKQYPDFDKHVHQILDQRDQQRAKSDSGSLEVEGKE